MRRPVRGVWLTSNRVVRLLTFWLRPAFVLRFVNRFQKIVGFDRSMALASSALSTAIPLSIVVGAVLADSGHNETANRIIDRFNLTGGGADAVNHVFAPTGGESAGTDIVGALLLVISVLSFSRAVQRLFEQTWELTPLSVRNTVNELLWALVLVLYLTVTGLLYAFLGGGRFGLLAALAVAPLTGVFLVSSGWLLTARRVPRRNLLPFGVVAAVFTAIYSVGATAYLPRLFSSLASRYGAIGAVFAMLTALFCAMIVIVGSAALGPEVYEELRRIRRGERPPDDEVRREWDKVIDHVRLQWHAKQNDLARPRPRGRANQP
jgi:membrane protein